MALVNCSDALEEHAEVLLLHDGVLRSFTWFGRGGSRSPGGTFPPTVSHAQLGTPP